MSDFVTRLEQELHQAAVRQESAGALRGVALPRLRVAAPGLAVGVVAAAALALALAGVAGVLLGSDPDRSAALPAELEGEWLLPVELGVQGGQRDELSGNARGQNSLLLLEKGSTRCDELGIDSACYVIDDSVEGAIQWGVFESSAGELTFSRQSGNTVEAPATYRWRIADRALMLAAVGPDVDSERATAFGSGPLTRAGHQQAVPEDWTAKAFTSDRYGYMLRFPAEWSAQPAEAALPGGGLAVNTNSVDKLSREPRGTGRPMVLAGAHAVARGTTLDDWTTAIDEHITTTRGCDAGGRRRITVGGEPAVVSVYPTCEQGHAQWATFVHAGQGYQLVWVGDLGQHEADAPLFQAILETLDLTS